MAKGKFSQPRPYKEEDREIERAFRQVTQNGDGKRPVIRGATLSDTQFYQVRPQEETSVEAAEPSIPGEAFPSQEPILSEEHFLNEEFLPDEEEFYDQEPEDEKRPFIEILLDFFQHNRTAVLVGTCAVALVLIVAVIAGVLFSGSSDPYDGKILNNVTIAGVNVGGMTQSEAVTAVKSATSGTYPKTDMVVQMPDTTLYLSPKDTGASLDVKAAVAAAYDYGRTGTKAEMEAAYQASLTGNHTIGLLPYLNLDEAYIQGVLEEYASQYENVFTQSGYELEGDMPALEADKFDETAPCQVLVLTIGQPGLGLDVEAIYEDILDAYSLNTFLVTVEEVQANTEPETLDLDAIYKEVCLEPVDASVDMQTYEIIPGTYGYTFDLNTAKLLLAHAQFGDTLRIDMEYVAPEVLEEGDVFFRDELGFSKTAHSNNSNRTNNLKLACQAINGLVLNPGETFSFNEVVGQRTTARGYKSAPSYAGEEVVDTVGGGICQVSSTLYHAVLLADLDVVSRTNHSYTVNYMDLGMDAAVSWGSPDFKFRNNTGFPIQLEASVDRGNVTIRILGTDEKDYYVKMEYEIASTYSYDTVYREYEADNAEGYSDGTVLQSGVTGYYVKTYKCKYSKETGKLLTRDYVTNSSYKSKDKVVVKLLEPTTEPTTEETTIPTEETTVPTETTLPPETTAPTETTAPAETTTPTEVTQAAETTAAPTEEITSGTEG